MHAVICSHIPIRFIIRLALIRSLDDPDVKAVDEQVNAGIGVPVSYISFSLVHEMYHFNISCPDLIA